jgi:hypothetical protein
LRGIGSVADAARRARPATVPAVDTDLAGELLAMTAADHAAQAGALDGTFGEQLAWRRVTAANGDRLREILDARGWPTAAQVGEQAAQCAWLVAQHADRQLDVQRRALELLAGAVAAGTAPARQEAFLRDRVLVNEGRPQVYGTQVAGVVDGVPVPWPVEDPDGMDDRRAAVGIEPFAVHTARHAPPG